MKPGTKVRMSLAFKNKMLELNSPTEKRCKRSINQDHIEEFGDCIGIVQGYINYNNVCEPQLQSKIGPEVDVRWQPSNLRYAYLPEGLEVVE